MHIRQLATVLALLALVGCGRLDLAREHYPDTPIRGDLPGNRGFFDCGKAERVLGWSHDS